MKHTIWRSTLVFLPILLAFWGFTLSNPNLAQAGALTNLSISVADKSKSVSTKYTLTFKNATKIPKDGGRINFKIYGPGWDTGFSQATIDTSSPGGLNIYSRNWDGVTLYTSQDIAADTTISFTLGSVRNPSRGGYFHAQIWTSQYYADLDGSSQWSGDYPTAYYEIGTNTNLVGTITDNAGVVLPYASVSLNNSGYTQNYYTYTDKNGLYGVADIPADTYTFRISSPSTYGTGKVYFPPNETTLTIPASGVTTKNASFLATPKTISGKVTKDSLTGLAVTDATVSLYKVGGSGWANVNTDSSGNFSFSVPGGTWSISVYPKNYPADWVAPYNSSGNETLAFSEDTTTESKTKNFVVKSLSVTVKGKIVKPDGTAVPKWGASMSFNGTSTYTDPTDSTKTRTDNVYFSASLNNDDGSFSTKVTAGTYTVSGWSSDSNLSFPKVDNFTVSENDIKDLGTITLSEKKDVITGKVTDNTGAAVAGASVSAWKNESNNYEWGNTTSDPTGGYTIKVTPGTWQVSAYPTWKEGGSDYVHSGKPTSVTVKSGEPATVNFTFQKVTATIKGLITDPDGKVLSSLTGWASGTDGSQDYSGNGSAVTNGAFTLRVPKGKWTVSAHLSSSDYGNPDSQVVEVADNETKSITMKAVTNDAELSGTFYDESGNKVTGKWISINANKDKTSSWQWASVDQANATYKMKLSAGTWRMSWWIDQALGYSADNSDAQVTIAAKEKKTYDITLKKNTATIKGKATKVDGTPMSLSWVTADSRAPAEKTAASTKYYTNGVSSNVNGEFKIPVPAGTYWVSGNMWHGSGYINPKHQKVTVEDGKEVEANLVFRAADAKITGKVTYNGAGVNAYVTTSSDDGGEAETNANHSGDYELSVSSGTKWYITAIWQDGKEVYKTDQAALVDLGSSTSASQNLEVKKQAFTLPDKKSTVFPANQATTVDVGDGTKLTIPAGSITESNDSITISVEPTATLAVETGTEAVKYGYDVKLTKNDGTEITKFKNNITIESQYTGKSDDKFLNSEVKLAYYDKSSGTWKELTGCTKTDSDTKTTASSVDINSASVVTITCPVNHATVFALIAPIDSIAPSAPTETKATAGDAIVTLSWKNPTQADFKSVSIYRSTTAGTLGSKIASGQTGVSYEDKSLTNGTTYYHTIRAVDASANESTNTTQVSATPAAVASSSAGESGSGAASASALPKAGGDLLNPANRSNLSPLMELLIGLMATIVLAGLVIAKVRSN